MKKEENKEKVKFDLKRLKGKRVTVNCKTEEQFQNFINWVNSLEDNNFKDNYWDDYKEETCLRLSTGLYWGFGNKYFYKEEGYEIISYEESLLTQPNKETKPDKDGDKIPLTVEQLKKFYLEAYNAGGLSKIVCGELSDKDINNLDDRSWMEALIKAYN